MATGVIGRDEELGAIEAFLGRRRVGPARARSVGRARDREDDPLGKRGSSGATRTLAAGPCASKCRGRGSLSFAALSDLLAPVFDDVAPSLAPLRRRALEVALLLAEPGAQTPNPRAIGVAVLDVLRALAEGGPVLVALDDRPWLDPSSAAVLQIALRRLRRRACQPSCDGPSGAGGRDASRARDRVSGTTSDPSSSVR